MLCRSRESILHVLSEQHAWLETYCVASPEPGAAEEAPKAVSKEQPVLSRL